MRTALLVIVAAVGCQRPAASPSPPPPVPMVRAPVLDPALVARGSYVAALAGCATCHTPMTAGVSDGSRPFAGGLEGRLPDGTVWRSPNITPDYRTGIGAWKPAEISAGIRQGVRPDGDHLYPIMPYVSFHAMTNHDARAVVSFLLAQKPIENRVEPARLAMTPILLAPPKDPVDPKDQLGHGEYLASLMHCGACHTPRMGPVANVMFAGGTAFVLSDGRTIKAPNITSDPDTGIGKWSEDELMRTLRTMRRPDGTSIEGPMAMYQQSWNRITEDDARALVAYVKSIPPVKNDVEHRPPVTGMP